MQKLVLSGFTRGVSLKFCGITCANCRKFSITQYRLKFKRLPRSLMYVRPDKVVTDEQVAEQFRENKFGHYRHHPGVCNINAVTPPRAFESALLKSSADIDLSTLKAEAKSMHEYLDHRQTTWSEDMVKTKYNELLHTKIEKLAEKRRKEVEQELGGSPTDEELYEYVQNQSDSLRNSVDKNIKRLMYTWKQMNYKTQGRCLTYALARFPADYAVLCRVFNEIRARNPRFHPRSVFDFGSGVGSTIWATENTWASSGLERREGSDEASPRRLYFCVDTSDSMIDLAGSLLRDGDPYSPRLIFDQTDVFFRQFLPATNDRQYDLVVSAFSMMEMQTYEERMRTVLNLWHKTKDFLVIIENGNRYGYTILMEIRDYILAGGREIWRQELKRLLSNHCPEIDQSFVNQTFRRNDLSDEEKIDSVRKRLVETGHKNVSHVIEQLAEMPTLLPHGHVFAPCPHDAQCPRLRDVVPCKFEQTYFDFQLSGHKRETRRSTFSYLVLKKGARNADIKDDTEFAAKNEWPRLVRPVLVRKGHSLCEMCTKNGFLSELTSTKNNSDSNAFHMIKRSDWGDLLPIKLDFSQQRFDQIKERYIKFKEKNSEKGQLKNKSSTGKEKDTNSNNNETTSTTGGSFIDDDVFDGFEEEEEKPNGQSDSEDIFDKEQHFGN